MGTFIVWKSWSIIIFTTSRTSSCYFSTIFGIFLEQKYVFPSIFMRNMKINSYNNLYQRKGRLHIVQYYVCWTTKIDIFQDQKIVSQIIIWGSFYENIPRAKGNLPVQYIVLLTDFTVHSRAWETRSSSWLSLRYIFFRDNGSNVFNMLS